MLYKYLKEPILKIDVVHPKNGKQVKSVEFMIDTGAGYTVIPAYVIAKLRLSSSGMTRVKDWNGNVSLHPTYQIRLRLEEHLSNPFLVISTKEQIGLLGDDFVELNKYFLFLDKRNYKCGVFSNCKYIQTTPTVIVELSD